MQGNALATRSEEGRGEGIHYSPSSATHLVEELLSLSVRIRRHERAPLGDVMQWAVAVELVGGDAVAVAELGKRVATVHLHAQAGIVQELTGKGL